VNRVRHQTVRLDLVLVALGIALGAAALAQRSGSNRAFKRMPDGRQWTKHNLSVPIDGSYRYGCAADCRRYGRLHTWEAAQRARRLLGERWRLPTTGEWRLIAKHHGGVLGHSDDGGKGAYTALVTGGGSGFGVVFGGRRDPDGQYARLEAHERNALRLRGVRHAAGDRCRRR